MKLLTAVAAMLITAAPMLAQDVTEGMTLEQVVARASQHSHAALAARSALEAARQRSSAFDARLLPQISLSGMAPSYNKSISPVIQPDGSTAFLPRGEMETSVGITMSQALPFLGGRVFVSSLLNRIESLSSDGSSYWQSAPVLVGIEHDLFRPRSDLWDKREQDISLDLAERQYLEAREEGAARAANAYFDLYAAQVTAANAVANAAVNDSLYLISQGRYQVGKIAENELLQSELAVLRARTAVAASQLEVERATATLRIELNLPVDAALSIAPPTEVMNISVDTTIAVAEALRNRSVLATMELQAVRAKRQVTSARLSNMFNARLTAGFGYNQTAPLFDDAYHSPLQQQRFGLQVEMPLVQWGGGRAEVAAARAEEKRVSLLADRSRRELAQEAHFAALRYGLTRSQLLVGAKADTVATRRFNVAKDRYVIGKIGIGDLYIAQTEKDAALQSYVQAVRAYWIAYYNLRRVTLYDFQLGRRID